jgi:thymidylate synthase
VLPEFETLEDLLKLTGKDFKLEGYNPHGFIKAPQAS